MAEVFPSLERGGFESLMRILADMQRQGAAQKARTGPMIYEALSQTGENIAGGIERRRQREFAASEARNERTFRTDLAGTEFQNRLEAGREEDRLARLRQEDERTFAAGQAEKSARDIAERERQDRLFRAGQARAVRAARCSSIVQY